MKTKRAILAFAIFLMCISGCTELKTYDASGETTKKHGIGDTIEENGVKMSLLGNEILAEDGGEQLITFEIEIENNSQEQLLFLLDMNFSAFADGYKITYDYELNAALDERGYIDSFTPTTIFPGKKIKGTAAYAVPEDWKEIEIMYQPNLIDNNTLSFFITQ